MNLYELNPEMCPNFLGLEENDPNVMEHQDPFSFPYYNDFADISGLNSFNECHVPYISSNFPLDDGDPIEVPEIPDTCFNFITNLLREDNSDDRPGATLQDYMTPQVAGEICSFSANQYCLPPVCQNSLCSIDDYFNISSSFTYSNVANDHNNDGISDFGSTLIRNLPIGGDTLNDLVQNNYIYSNTQFDQTNLLSLNCPNTGISNGMVNPEIVQEAVQCNDTTDNPRGRKHNEGDERENRGGNERENRGGNERENRGGNERSSKFLAPSNEVFEQIDQYGDVLLCPEGRSKPAALCSSLRTNNSQNSEDLKSKNGGSSSKGSRKRRSKGGLVDLLALLTRCAQCVAQVNLIGAYEMLNQIREHSSPSGDFLQRVAHYLANGLEARLEGKGLELTRANERIPPSEVLKANRVYVASVPYKIMSYYTTNKTIAKLAEEAPSIHIIDFGIYYGLQWPCIIQNLSKRPNGPPKIRITGIDFPEPGFRPAERVEETGRCLAKYCERYNVPFEYHAIAQKWETIQVEDLHIERNEPLVVNCLYRSHNLYDESVDQSSPRDAFLSLVRKINPDIFTHGIVNSTSSVPFFLNRFKEAMFHYSALFDVFEKTMSQEDNERMLLESKLYGNQALNVIACEGIERVERPETTKQWQVRTQRAGFEQVPLDRDLLKRARAMVKRNFREEFSYDEDGLWVVQGWKGRILYAISCWKPIQ